MVLFRIVSLLKVTTKNKNLKIKKETSTFLINKESQEQKVQSNFRFQTNERVWQLAEALKETTKSRCIS